MEDSLPDSSFTMKNVQFVNTGTKHLVPKFKFENLGKLHIENFYYESKVVSDRITGFKMFEFFG